MKKRIIAEVFLLFAMLIGVGSFYLYSNVKQELPAAVADWSALSIQDTADKKEEQSITVEEETQPIAAEEERYYYQQLNEEEQVIYTEIYNTLKDMLLDRELSTTDEKQVDHVFQCVANDHPELFFVEGYTYTKYNRNDVCNKLTFSGTYTKSEEERQQCQQKIDAYTSACLAAAPSGTDDYAKVKYLYDYLIAHTEYEIGCQDNQNICSVFIQGVSVCMGYARAMQYLLEQLGIPCTIVNGYADGGQSHAWNLVYMDGNYYHVDVTWGDGSYTLVNDASQSIGMVNYGFFGVTTDQITKTHTIQNEVPLPYCVATTDNYYVKEGYYFTANDTTQISNVFQKAYAEGRDSVELKCDSLEVYQQIHQYLLEEQHIFDYLSDTVDTVSYYDGEDLLLLEFWLK